MAALLLESETLRGEIWGPGGTRSDGARPVGGTKPWASAGMARSAAMARRGERGRKGEKRGGGARERPLCWPTRRGAARRGEGLRGGRRRERRGRRGRRARLARVCAGCGGRLPGGGAAGCLEAGRDGGRFPGCAYERRARLTDLSERRDWVGASPPTAGGWLTYRSAAIGWSRGEVAMRVEAGQGSRPEGARVEVPHCAKRCGALYREGPSVVFGRADATRRETGGPGGGKGGVCRARRAVPGADGLVCRGRSKKKKTTRAARGCRAGPSASVPTYPCGVVGTGIAGAAARAFAPVRIPDLGTTCVLGYIPTII